jgi:hypothetical protein
MEDERNEIGPFLERTFLSEIVRSCRTEGKLPNTHCLSIQKSTRERTKLPVQAVAKQALILIDFGGAFAAHSARFLVVQLPTGGSFTLPAR